MSKNYRPIMDGCRKLTLEKGGCGDDDCCCSWYSIFAIYADDHPAKPPYYGSCPLGWRARLWESTWFWHDTESGEREEIREEVAAACEHYGIIVELDINEFWWWEGERQL